MDGNYFVKMKCQNGLFYHILSRKLTKSCRISAQSSLSSSKIKTLFMLFFLRLPVFSSAGFFVLNNSFRYEMRGSMRAVVRGYRRIDNTYTAEYKLSTRNPNIHFDENNILIAIEENTDAGFSYKFSRLQGGLLTKYINISKVLL